MVPVMPVVVSVVVAVVSMMCMVPVMAVMGALELGGWKNFKKMISVIFGTSWVTEKVKA